VPLTCPNCSYDGKSDSSEANTEILTGIVGVSDGDSVGYWECTRCGHRWPCDGGRSAEIARDNIDRGRSTDF